MAKRSLLDFFSPEGPSSSKHPRACGNERSDHDSESDSDCESRSVSKAFVRPTGMYWSVD